MRKSIIPRSLFSSLQRIEKHENALRIRLRIVKAKGTERWRRAMEKVVAARRAEREAKRAAKRYKAAFNLLLKSTKLTPSQQKRLDKIFILEPADATMVKD